MANWRDRYRQSVKTHGAAAVAKATRIPRNTVLSIVAGIEREGNAVLAEARVHMLDLLETSKAEGHTP